MLSLSLYMYTHIYIYIYILLLHSRVPEMRRVLVGRSGRPSRGQWSRWYFYAQSPD